MEAICKLELKSFKRGNKYDVQTSMLGFRVMNENGVKATLSEETFFKHFTVVTL